VEGDFEDFEHIGGNLESNSVDNLVSDFRGELGGDSRSDSSITPSEIIRLNEESL
jgi:hypothetical protein